MLTEGQSMMDHHILLVVKVRGRRLGVLIDVWSGMNIYSKTSKAPHGLLFLRWLRFKF